MYRLHCFCQSGNSYKVAFLLRALGQAYENVFVDFMHGMTRDAAWRASTNEMGEAPVLEEGARRLTQTGVILTHLAKKHGADDRGLFALRLSLLSGGGERLRSAVALPGHRRLARAPQEYSRLGLALRHPARRAHCAEVVRLEE